MRTKKTVKIIYTDKRISSTYTLLTVNVILDVSMKKRWTLKRKSLVTITSNCDVINTFFYKYEIGDAANDELPWAGVFFFPAWHKLRRGCGKLVTILHVFASAFFFYFYGLIFCDSKNKNLMANNIRYNFCRFFIFQVKKRKLDNRKTRIYGT